MFKDMTFELCSKEGEDDCLESWRKNHKSYFTQEGRKYTTMSFQKTCS